jgi:hypothetical protein
MLTIVALLLLLLLLVELALGAKFSLNISRAQQYPTRNLDPVS